MVRITSYLIFRILRARPTKFANEKKIGAKTAPPGGAKKGQKLNFDQFQPNLVESIPYWRKCNFVLKKGVLPPLGPIRGQKRAKYKIGL